MKHLHVLRFCAIFAIVLLIVILRWYFVYDMPLFGIDDANIYFVYVQNFVEGNGFVYTPGGEKVEGFTSLAWVLILSVFYLFGNMELLTAGANLLFISFTILKLINFVENINTKDTSGNIPLFSWPSILVLGFLCLIPGYLDWTILTLIETSLWSFLLVSISLNLCYLYISPEDQQKSRSLYYLLPLLVLTRPESLLWGFIFLLIRFYQVFIQAERKGQRLNLQKIVVPFSLFILTIGFLFISRWSYFGYLFPNTYYAKVSQDVWKSSLQGLFYLLRYIKANPFVPVFLSASLIGTMLIFQKLRRGFVTTYDHIHLTVFFITCINILIPFFTGGDHFYLSRFYQPLYPVLLLSIFNFPFWSQYFHLKTKVSKGIYLSRFILSLAGLILILSMSRFSLFNASPIKKEFDIAGNGRISGQKLNDLFASFPSYPSVGTYLAGGLAYMYKGEIIDLLGLNNTLMAHSKKKRYGYKNHDAFDKQVFYELAPDLLFIKFIGGPKEVEMNETDSSDFQNRIYKFIFLDQKFRNVYLPVVIEDRGGNLLFQAYVRKDYFTVIEESVLNISLIHHRSQ